MNIYIFFFSTNNAKKLLNLLEETPQMIKDLFEDLKNSSLT